MPIRWKVTTRTRSSCLIDGRSRFGRNYLKDTTVNAEPGTFGIFTFNTKKNAEEFKEAQNMVGLKILKVKGIGEAKGLPMISGRLRSSDLSLFYKDSNIYRFRSPAGTICYPAVEVLE